MSEVKISAEMADEQLNLFFEYYDIDENEINDEDIKRGMISARNKLHRAIMQGRLEILEELDSLVIRQTIKRPPKGLTSNPIVYKELDGTAKIAMKDRKTADQYGKIYALLGKLSGEGIVVIQQLKGADLSVAEMLGVLFLTV